MIDAKDLIERLRGYNPPDRTVPEQRQMAQDIADAAAELTRLQARVAELEAENARLKDSLRQANFVRDVFAEAVVVQAMREKRP